MGSKKVAEKLTGRMVDGVAATGAKQFIPDGGMPGLFLRVTPGGAKSFVLRRQHDGARIEHTIGRAEEITPQMARDKAAALLGDLRLQGINPAKVRREQIRREQVARENTMKALVEGYLANQDPQKSERSVADERYRLGRYVLPRLGDMPYTDIKRADLVLAIRQIGAETGGVTANRCHQYLSQVFNYALNGGAIEYNPIAGLPKQFREVRRARILTDEELSIVWRACETARVAPRQGSGLMPKTARALQLAMLTLQRGHQIREMRREDVSLERREWIVPASRMKGRTAFLIPLSGAAADILAEAMAATDQDHIFSNNRRDEPMSVNALNHSLRHVLLEHGKTSAGPHDVRRTGRTLLTSRRVGVSRDTAERVIGHVVGSDVERRYDLNEYAEEKRDALEAWAVALRAIVDAGAPHGASLSRPAHGCEPAQGQGADGRAARRNRSPGSGR